MLRDRKTYTSCSDLPLYNFIKIVVLDQLEYLYSEPKHRLKRQVDLQPVWETIFDEYNTLSGNKSSGHILALVREITVINNKLAIISRAVSFLEEKYNAELCDMLRNMGFRYKFTPETLMNDLKLTLSSAKQLVLQKQEAESDLAKLNTSPSQEVNEEDFYKLVRQMSRFNGFHIDTHKTTVMEFLKDIEIFNAENAPKA